MEYKAWFPSALRNSAVQSQKNLTEKFLASSPENHRISWLSPWEVFPQYPMETSSMQSFYVSASTHGSPCNSQTSFEPLAEHAGGGIEIPEGIMALVVPWRGKRGTLPP